ncbi:hypothetical protein AYI68_g3346 [Smittium mucronatum]|uniref:Uncharacterized protein n=1 Tax=Smittium mucronatum TaxID=133383 RepID=A0A1R0H062_9FUNG|nr:hypothetical protein AYI68_g3346 [Smittium mucronatum]
MSQDELDALLSSKKTETQKMWVQHLRRQQQVAVSYKVTISNFFTEQKFSAAAILAPISLTQRIQKKIRERYRGNESHKARFRTLNLGVAAMLKSAWEKQRQPMGLNHSDLRIKNSVQEPSFREIELCEQKNSDIFIVENFGAPPPPSEITLTALQEKT